MSRGQVRRIRRNKSQWIEILRRFEASGLEASRFCRREGVTVASLQRWRQQLGSAAKSGFVELVATTPVAVSASQPWSVEVVLPNGACLRFRE